MPRPPVRAPARRISVGAVVFALLVAATLAAFAWSQIVKRDPLVIDKVTLVGFPVMHPKHPVYSFTPNRDCRYDRARIRFRTTRSDDAIVQIVKPGGRVVITLARDRFLKRYHFHTYYWDGHRRGGEAAAPGRYKLRVKLLNQDRVLVPPGSIKLHRAPRRPLKGCARPGEDR
jgi:translation initiation factor IF-1